MTKTIVKGYRFRIYPTKEQEEFFAKSFGCCRFVWNYFLNERKEFYLKNKENPNKKSLNYHDNAKSLTKLKSNKDFLWLNEVNSQSLQSTLRNLDIAYLKFFKKQAKFPQFKFKNNKQSFTVPQSFKFINNKLWIPKLKIGLKINQHRKLENDSKICFVTISKSKTNKYFASFIVEEKILIETTQTNKKIGMDLGLKDLLVLSDGTKIKNPKIAWKQRKKLQYLHRQLSKKKKGSKNKEKSRLRLTKVYEKVTNIKTDFTHKLTSQVVKNHDIIVCEDLKVVNMMRNHRLARSISEVSWYEITRQLQYKSEWQNKKFIKIDRFFPSSKTCGCCGYINQELKLDERKWVCPACKIELDRDINAAQNILKQGLNILNSGEGLPSESKQKLREASKKVASSNRSKDNRVYKLRSPRIYSGE